MVLVVATYGNTGCTRKVSQKFHQKQPSATLVSPHPMSLGEDVSLHCANQVVLRRTRLEGDFGVERIQFCGNESAFGEGGTGQLKCHGGWFLSFRHFAAALLVSAMHQSAWCVRMKMSPLETASEALSGSRRELVANDSNLGLALSTKVSPE